MRDLKILQEWMLGAIRQPPGVEQRSRRDANEIVSIESVICPSRTLDSKARLQIYGNAYFARLIECLGDEFPAVKFAAGSDAFDGLALQYLDRFPSTSYSLEHLGKRFADFLRETRPSGLAENSWADFLIELSVLELLYSEVFNGPGTESLPTLNPDELSSIEPSNWDNARLIPVPCLRLAQFQFPVHEFATAVRKRQESPNLPAPKPTWLIVTRQNYVVRRTAVSEAEFFLLDRLMRGQSLASSIERTADRFPQLTPEHVRDWFARWGAANYFQEIQVD